MDAAATAASASDGATAAMSVLRSSMTATEVMMDTLLKSLQVAGPAGVGGAVNTYA
jgi:hypothetical protein